MPSIRSINLINSVKFLGVSYVNPITDENPYQGKTFTLGVAAEGVQASHYAFRDVWGIPSPATVPAPGVTISTQIP